MAGKQLRITYDPRDVRRVRAYTMDWRLIGDLPLNGEGGHSDDVITETMNRDLMAAKRTDARAKKIVREHRMTGFMTPEQYHAHQRAEYQRKLAQQASDKSLKIVRTPLDSPSNDDLSQQQQIAAGAESYFEDENQSAADLLRDRTRKDLPDDLDPIPFNQASVVNDLLGNEIDEIDLSELSTVDGSEDQEDDTDVFPELDTDPLRIHQDDDDEDGFLTDLL